MKKISKILAVMTVVASVFMICGCGLKDAISRTYDTWYKYNKEGGLNIPVGDVGTGDSESAAGQMMENAELYVFFNPDDGLKIAIQSTKAQKIELAGGLLETSVDVVTGATKDYTNEQFGSGRWSGLMLSGNFTKTEAPKIVTDPDNCINLTNSDKFTFQWRKVLRNILINKLLGE